MLDRLLGMLRPREQVRAELVRRVTRYGLPKEAVDPMTALAIVLGQRSTMSASDAFEMVTQAVGEAWVAYRARQALGLE